MRGFYGENKENDFTNDDEILNILEDYRIMSNEEITKVIHKNEVIN